MRQLAVQRCTAHDPFSMDGLQIVLVLETTPDIQCRWPLSEMAVVTSMRPDVIFPVGFDGWLSNAAQHMAL